VKLETQDASRGLNLSPLARLGEIACSPEDSDAEDVGKDLLEDLESLPP
jgi:hypothetical protein